MVFNRNMLHCYRILRNSFVYKPRFSVCNCTTNANETGQKPKTGGFAEAFDRYSKGISEPEPVKEESFSTLFRKSKFNDLGDPEGKIVTGRIFHVVDNDLYIDFGWKFYCVCTRPQKNASEYVRDRIVRILLKDLELSSRFLGSKKDLTILEADAILLGLVSSPAKKELVSPSPS